MKKIKLLVALFVILAIACKKTELNNPSSQSIIKKKSLVIGDSVT